MKHASSLVLLSSIYLLTVIIGLQVALVILPLMYPPEGVEPTIPPVVAEPGSVTASAQIFLYIIVVTAILLLLIKLNLNKIIKIVMSFSIIIGMLLTMTALLDWVGVILGVVILALYFLRRNDYNLVNAVLIFTIAGIGAVLGSSLTLIPALVLVLALAVYDYISVYITKHMVTIAENAKGALPFMFLIPIGEKQLGLGTGDIAIPLTLIVSLFKDYGPGYAIPTALALKTSINSTGAYPAKQYTLKRFQKKPPRNRKD
ncbi:MAG: presenilin family intramembrane aspartyl protease [Candidatus Altiarchaeota archaeon]|nr:presenilin family intramembrane aspartyl protease [Candidatus Altiarchaeota archaeon]